MVTREVIGDITAAKMVTMATTTEEVGGAISIDNLPVDNVNSTLLHTIFMKVLKVNNVCS